MIDKKGLQLFVHVVFFDVVYLLHSIYRYIIDYFVPLLWKVRIYIFLLSWNRKSSSWHHCMNLQQITDEFGVAEFLPSGRATSWLKTLFCDPDTMSSSVELCQNILFLLCGFNPSQFNTVSVSPLRFGQHRRQTSTSNDVRQKKVPLYLSMSRGFIVRRRERCVLLWLARRRNEI
jgi:hypothetical protein